MTTPTLFQLTAILTTSMMVVAPVAVAVTRGQSSDSVHEQLVAEIESTMACRRIPGLSVTVVQNGVTVMSRGFGHARIVTDDDVTHDAAAGRMSPPSAAEPCTGNTKFAIASLSKAFTAALIAVLLKENEHRSVCRRTKTIYVIK